MFIVAPFTSGDTVIRYLIPVSHFEPCFACIKSQNMVVLLSLTVSTASVSTYHNITSSHSDQKLSELRTKNRHKKSGSEPAIIPNRFNYLHFIVLVSRHDNYIINASGQKGTFLAELHYLSHYIVMVQ